MIRAAMLAALALMLGATRSDPLAGRIAGPAQDCITIDQAGGPDIVDANTILYRQSGARIWRTGPIGECALHPLDTLIVDVYGGRICRNDRFRTRSPNSIIPSGSCRFGAFVPYDRAAR